MNGESRPAIFLDRDNTLIRDPGYLRDPSQVRLLDGAASAVARFKDAGYAVVVATNQSGIARGYLTEEELASIHSRMQRLLSEQGAPVDAIYHCPYLDGADAVVERYRQESELRKPRPGMLLQAARDMNLDLNRSWMIGDSPRDIEAGRAAGCKTILLAGENTALRDLADHVATDLPSAADRILGNGSHEISVHSEGTWDAAFRPSVSEPLDAGDPREDSEVVPLDAPQLVESGPPVVNLESSLSTESRPPLPPEGKNEIILEQILEELRMTRREAQHSEFSIGQLAGAIAQAFALCAIAWALYASVNNDVGAAVIRFLAGIAFQLVAMTWFLASKKK